MTEFQTENHYIIVFQSESLTGYRWEFVVIGDGEHVYGGTCQTQSSAIDTAYNCARAFEEV